jgi:hypothetical protein
MAVKAPSADDQNAAVNTDWSTWTPGGNAARLLVEPPGGLARLLDQTNATIKGMDESMLDMVGTALADALNRGLTSAELAQNLASIADSPRHALTIAQTEMHRALSVQAVANYSEWGVQQIQWGASDTDDECADNDDEGPVEIGHVFTSGDTEPPAHPNCRCWIEPVVEGNTDQPEDVPVAEDGGDVPAIEDVPAVEDAAAQAGADALAVDTHPDLLPIDTEPAPLDTEALAAQINFQFDQGLTNTALSNSEYMSVQHYKGAAYEQINQLLRDPAAADKYFRSSRASYTKDAISRDISNLTKLIDQAPALPAETITYRGISGGSFADQIASLSAGDTFTDAGFTSTSLLPDFVAGFTDARGVTLQIVNPAGTKGLMVDPLTMPVKPNKLGEGEWLLPPGSTFEVISNDGQTISVRVKQ